MPIKNQLKNELKGNINEIIEKAFDSTPDVCYFTMVKKINDIIFNYFEKESRVVKGSITDFLEDDIIIQPIENRTYPELELDDYSTPFDTPYVLENKTQEVKINWKEKIQKKSEILKELPDWTLIEFEITSGFKYLAYVRIFEDLVQDLPITWYEPTAIGNLVEKYSKLDEELYEYMKENETNPYIDNPSFFDIVLPKFEKHYQNSSKQIMEEIQSIPDSEVDKIFLVDTEDITEEHNEDNTEDYPAKDFELETHSKEVEMVEIIEKPKYTLTDHQNEVVTGLLLKIEEIMSNSFRMTNTPAEKMAMFEGAAGTGKTFTMSYVLETLSTKYKLAMCSPTHEALSVIRSTLKNSNIDFTEDPNEFGMDSNIIIKTIASYLNIKMNRDLENGTENFEENKRGTILNCDILCIDECSMISKELIQMMIKKLGIQFKMVLFIGDEPQLPSPSDGEDGNGLFKLPFKYSLTQVVRQKEGSHLLNIAWWIRNFILNKDVRYKPSQLLTEALHNNFDIFLTHDQNAFIASYLSNPSTSKYIGTYTNGLTDEYNIYIRNLAITGYENLNYEIYPYRNSLNEIDETDLEKSNATKIGQDMYDYKEFFVGEYLKAAEINQRNEKVYHQNGDIFRINSLQLKEHKVMIETPSTSIHEPATINEFIIRYWEIEDTDFKLINVIVKEDQQLYKDILSKLYQEAARSTGKRRFYKYVSFKEKFTKVNYLFASTLHKLQGKTCEDLYLDVRDLDKYYRNQPLTVLKLIYVALTRPTTKIHILI